VFVKMKGRNREWKEVMKIARTRLATCVARGFQAHLLDSFISFSVVDVPKGRSITPSSKLSNCDG
jgi:hypothetical protein